MKIRSPDTGDTGTSSGSPSPHPVRRYIAAAFWLLFIGLCLLELVYVPLFGVHTRGVPVPRWQMRPIDLFFHLVHSISPALVEPIQAVLFCSVGVGIVGMYLGFRVISRKTVLDAPTRVRVFDAITGDPGIHFNALMHRTGINRGTLRYHLGILTRTGKITCHRDGAFSRYLPEGWGISEKDTIVACRFRSGPDRLILAYLLSHPAATRNEIGRAAGISQSNVSWRIQRFLQEGIVRTCRGEGKNTWISLTGEAEATLIKLQSTLIPAGQAGPGLHEMVGQHM